MGRTAPTASEAAAAEERALTVTIVIPARNEASNLRVLLPKWRALDLGYSLVVVDGHSTDDTAEVSRSFGAEVILDNGGGKGAGIRFAIETIETDIIVFMDADNSHDPADIPKLVEPILKDEADHVSGSRVRGGSDELFGDFNNFLRATGNYIITTGINYRFGTRLSDAENGFRAIRTSVARNLNLRENIHTIEQEMVMKTLRKGYRLVEVPTHEYARLHGDSSISLMKVSFRFVYTWIRYLFID
ncbi:MAG: glycosyltransferase family 2 protein [Candidatus Eremiobacteraeota bacterium]|nr:glycosyltransferase family 2 protein [Candidatus Eremiobacteraeota bacterium]